MFEILDDVERWRERKPKKLNLSILGGGRQLSRFCLEMGVGEKQNGYLCMLCLTALSEWGGPTRQLSSQSDSYDKILLKSKEVSKTMSFLEKFMVYLVNHIWREFKRWLQFYYSNSIVTLIMIYIIQPLRSNRRIQEENWKK